MSEDDIKWKWEAPTVLSYRCTYADGFKAGQEAMRERAAELLENVAEVGSEEYASVRIRAAKVIRGFDLEPPK